MALSQSDILIVIDVQNDFCPGGALAVPHGDAVVPPINQLIDRFSHVVLTQDWHPRDHLSFASCHPGRSVYQEIDLSYGRQTLWPDHCVQGTRGAEFHPDLMVHRAELILRKGFRRAVDSYSAFLENDRTTKTGLASYLRERGFNRVFLAGLATDFCVAHSALDGRSAGFDVILVDEACRAISLDLSLERAYRAMATASVTRATISQIDSI